jgi:hypothetical protein
MEINTEEEGNKTPNKGNTKPPNKEEENPAPTSEGK